MRYTLFILAGLVGLAASAEASRSHHAPYKIAIVVGNNQGNAKDKPLRYAHSDAKKFHKTLLEVGGYNKGEARLLLGQSSAQVKAVLQGAVQQLTRVKRRTPNRSTVFLFYYSGHADNQALHLGRTLLSFHWIRKSLKKNPAQVRLAILDTCRSGQIIRTKGARRVKREVPLPPMIRNMTTRGMALITSSGVGEDSHELEQLRSSIFTHYLVSGLRGAADRDGDGKVSLREAYSYAYQRTISHTVFLSSGVQHPSFRNELRGHGHLILSRPKRASSKLLFGPKLTGTYYILNQKRDRLLAEIRKKRGEPKQLGLNAGRYTIVRRNAQSYQVQTVQLKKGDALRLHKQKMVALSYAWAASKGMSWVTRSLRPAYYTPSPYRTGFHVSVGLAALGLVSAGIFFGLTQATLNQHDKHIAKQGRIDPILENRAQSFNGATIASLSALGVGGVSALVFFLVHNNHVKNRKLQARRASKRTTVVPVALPHAPKATLWTTP